MKDALFEIFLYMVQIVFATFLLYDLAVNEILKGTVGTLQLYELKKREPKWKRRWCWFPLSCLQKRPIARLIYVVAYFLYVIGRFFCYAYPVSILINLLHPRLISMDYLHHIIDNVSVPAILFCAFITLILRATSSHHEDEELMNELVFLRKSIDQYETAKVNYQETKQNLSLSGKRKKAKLEACLMDQVVAVQNMQCSIVNLYRFPEADRLKECNRDEVITYTEQCAYAVSLIPGCDELVDDIRNQSYLFVYPDAFVSRFYELKTLLETAKEGKEKRQALQDINCLVSNFAQNIEASHDNNQMIRRDDSDELKQTIPVLENLIDDAIAIAIQEQDTQMEHDLRGLYKKFKLSAI